MVVLLHVHRRSTTTSTKISRKQSVPTNVPPSCRVLLSAISTVRIFVCYTYVYISWATSIHVRAFNTRKEATHNTRKKNTKHAKQRVRNET